MRSEYFSYILHILRVHIFFHQKLTFAHFSRVHCIFLGFPDFSASYSPVPTNFDRTFLAIWNPKIAPQTVVPRTPFPLPGGVGVPPPWLGGGPPSTSPGRKRTCTLHPILHLIIAMDSPPTDLSVARLSFSLPPQTGRTSPTSTWVPIGVCCCSSSFPVCPRPPTKKNQPQDPTSQNHQKFVIPPYSRWF